MSLVIAPFSLEPGSRINYSSYHSSGKLGNHFPFCLWPGVRSERKYVLWEGSNLFPSLSFLYRVMSSGNLKVKWN